MRKHKVGTVTLGCALVVMGVLFMTHWLIPSLSYTVIFKLWPLILIAIGVEVLLAQNKKVDFEYDGWAVVLMIVLVFFAMAMAAAQYSLDIQVGTAA